MNNRSKGNAYERIAAGFLESEGYTVICMNYCCRYGELDIVARDGEFLCFVEIKYRKDAKRGTPLEAINDSKKKKIIKAAEYYTAVFGIPDNSRIRFDAVGILGNEITLIKDAFWIS